MTIKQSVEKAIEGGFRLKQEHRENDGYASPNYSAILLDPLFWQSLGKAMGWGERDEESKKMYRISGGGSEIMIGMYQWAKQQHKFIDVIQHGKTAESFFDNL